MAEFLPALQKVLAHEDEYINDPDDLGGETYKGIARNRHSKWSGWVRIDMSKGQPGFPANLEKDAKLQEEIALFYQVNFWDTLSADNQYKCWILVEKHNGFSGYWQYHTHFCTLLYYHFSQRHD